MKASLSKVQNKKPNSSSGIGELQETSLHSQLKYWYAQQGDILEASVDGYVIDIQRSDVLIEIQTRQFSRIRRKLTHLLPSHIIRLVYPIPVDKWIVKLSDEGHKEISRRKSPRHGRIEHLFLELVRIPNLIAHPNFSIEVLLIQEDDLWRHDGLGSWQRRGWSIADRRLLAVIDRLLLTTPADLAALLPPGLPDPFSTRDLAELLGQPRYLAQKMVYCLRAVDALQIAGKRGNSLLYSIERL